jgi:spermidine/putrescine transport system permease protein
MSAITVDPQAPPERAPAPLRRRRRKLTSYILPVFTGLMILYLTSPVLLMIMYGFNDIQGERQTAKFTCCTLNWWKNWLAQTDLNQSLKVSISVAIPAAIIATILGALIGLVLGRYSFSGRGGLNFVIFLAIAVPEIVLGSALLSMFVQANGQLHLGIHIGYQTILFSHIGFSIAFVAITVRARVQGLDRSLENAAQDLFATPLVAFFKVTLPLIFPGVVAGFLLAFVLSLDDFVITNFVGGQTSTFPTWVYGATRIGVPPQVNVWGTLLFGAGLAAASINLVSSIRKGRKQAAAVNVGIARQPRT